MYLGVGVNLGLLCKNVTYGWWSEHFFISILYNTNFSRGGNFRYRPLFANWDFARNVPPAKIISTANGISRNFPPAKFTSREIFLLAKIKL